MNYSYKKIFNLTIFSICISGLCIISTFNFNLFHKIIDLIGIAISSSIFIFIWNQKLRIKYPFFKIIGVSFFFITFFEILTSLSSPPSVLGSNNEYSMILWMSSRYYTIFCYFFGSFVYSKKIKKKINAHLIFIIDSIIFTILIFLIFGTNIFSYFFSDGVIKINIRIISEVLIFSLAFITLLNINKQRRIVSNQNKTFKYISISIIIGVISDFLFFFGNTNTYSLLIHLLKLVSYYFLYESVIDIGFKNPLKLLLKNIETLENLLPICSECKKIRDGNGVWHTLEEYSKNELDILLTHGYCPDCLKKFIDKIEEKNI